MKGKAVNIVEIGPRDGFQNVPEWIPTETKLEIIRAMIAAGLRRIQLTSFVSPGAIPQMRDSAELCAALLPEQNHTRFFALVPNLTGARRAVACGLRELSFVLSASETHNLANTRRSVAQSLRELAELRESFPDIVLNLDIAMAFGCVFEGEIPAWRIEDLVGAAVKIGVDAVNLCDTVGLAVPDQVEELIGRIRQRFPQLALCIHIHDTRNMGMVNSYTALRNGVSSIQTTLGGLGGCPFAPGASGNTATEDLVYMLERMGWRTGVDFEKLMQAARLLKAKVKGNYSGHQIRVDQRHDCDG